LLPIVTGIVLVLKNGNRGQVSTSGFKRLGLVRVNGVISDSYDIVKQLRSFRRDNSIAGILLHVDSPGGAVAPSQEIYSELLNFKKEAKPIVVSMGNLAASGGYYVACPADKIFANPGTITGSIGVIMTVPLYKELAEKIGVQMRVYKAGKFKDIASPYRQMNQKEDQLMQAMLDDTHNQFIDDVADARKMNRDSLALIADGRIFTGRQALSVQLVDTLGGYEDALQYLRQYTGLGQNARVIERRERFSIIREWLVEEIIHIFPQLSGFTTPYSLHFLLSLDS
jgi:protease-4